MVVNGRPLKRAKSRVAADLIPNNQPIDLDAIADLRDARRPSDLINPRGSLDPISPRVSVDLSGPRGVLDLISPRGSVDLSGQRGVLDLVGGTRGVLDLDAVAAEGDVGRPFRESMRAFFSRYGRMMPIPPADDVAMMTWRVVIRAGGVEVELNVVDEDVVRSRSVYCDQCRVVGWSGHPVCAKRYHFIIKNENHTPLSNCLQTCCIHRVAESRCMACRLEAKNWGTQLDDTSHLLHAVVHSNGYGHLLRVNGFQGGSKRLTGRHIMSFWDRLCKFLHVRKVTVMDISKKHGMEYRLLHSVTTGHPWYGEWGYKFGAGSYGVNANSYHKAIETLSHLPLSLFTNQNRLKYRTQLHNLIMLYKSLSDQDLVTLRDLFRYITTLLHETNLKTPTPTKMLKFDEMGDVESAQNAMIKVLRAVDGGKWVGFRALKGATSKRVEAVDVLDRGLKELGGRTTGDGFVVASRCNSQTNTLEYRLEPATSQQIVLDCTAFSKPSTGQLLRDLRFLYNALLNPNTTEPYKPKTIMDTSLKAASILLDCKQFIKNYNDPSSNPLPLNPFMLHVWCTIELIDNTNENPVPPPELLVVSASATISDLKLHVSRIFQEIYPIFQGFHAESVITDENTSESALVKHVINPNEVIRVKGRCLGDMKKLGLFRMERGLENWIVECACGARDDDGERMMACDTCGVWQHTRCNKIRDSEEVPSVFVCVKCERKAKRKGKGLMSDAIVNRKVG